MLFNLGNHSFFVAFTKVKPYYKLYTDEFGGVTVKFLTLTVRWERVDEQRRVYSVNAGLAKDQID